MTEITFKNGTPYNKLKVFFNQNKELVVEIGDRSVSLGRQEVYALLAFIGSTC